ncbi:MAG TPA: hypothetical protein VHB21_07995 [Minicystis sp.]|nr:hypothetical protein [Minicystis sp.]
MGTSAAAALVVVVAGAGCDARAAPPSVRSFKAIVAERLPDAIPGLASPQDRMPDQQRRIKGSPVYVDGKPVGMVRLSELPPELKIRPEKVMDGREVPRWRVTEYLETAGVPLARVKAVHFLGMRGRATIITGEGLRKHGEQVLFSFTKGKEGGKARMHFNGKLPINTQIDSLAAMLVYVDKKPPEYDGSEHFFSFDGKTPIEGLPYVEAESEPKGTRVYVDGRLEGVLKRKILPNSLLVEGYDPAKPEFSLTRWLASMKVDTGAVAAVELVSNEDVVARLDAKAWEREAPKLSFYLTRRSQGMMAIHLPADDAAAKAAAEHGPPGDDGVVKVSAIEIYRRTRPPARDVKPLWDVVQNGGPGSGSPQGDGENRGNRGGQGAARGMHNSDGE